MHWQEVKPAGGGKAYYFNKMSNQTTWERPRAMGPPAPTALKTKGQRTLMQWAHRHTRARAPFVYVTGFDSRSWGDGLALVSLLQRLGAAGVPLAAGAEGERFFSARCAEVLHARKALEPGHDERLGDA